jgi:hypothetical protein
LDRSAFVVEGAVVLIRKLPVSGKVRRFRRNMVSVAAVMAVAAALTVVPAAPSSATTIFVTDNTFEGINSPPVSFEHVGDGNGFMVLNNPAQAETFNGYAVIVTTPDNFSSVRTDISIMAGGSCNLRVAVNPFGNTETVNVEVIDPVSWTYTALKSVRLSGTSWHQIAMSFRPSGSARLDQVFRVSVVDPTLPAPAQTPPFALAHVDSFHAECSN